MRGDPNFLLAVTSVISLALVTSVACVMGPPGVWIKYLLAAVLSAGGFILLNGLYMRVRNRRPKPMISRDAPMTIIVAMVFPLTMILSSVLPLIAPNGDYGIMLIVGGVFTGLAIQSAIAARHVES